MNKEICWKCFQNGFKPYEIDSDQYNLEYDKQSSMQKLFQRRFTRFNENKRVDHFALLPVFHCPLTGGYFPDFRLNCRYSLEQIVAQETIQ